MVTGMVNPGDAAPDFTLPDQDGRPVTLSGQAGQTVVLYFYPRANTPGCTTQACGVRDHRDAYAAADATVIGVSPDPPARLKRFDERHGLDFILLADADHSVAERYGVWVEKLNYGKRYWGVQRATFVIDPEGIVRHVVPKATPKTHDEVVLKVLADLAQAA